MNKTGYQGFGSFHSENVEELVSSLPSDYQIPDIAVKASPDQLSKLYNSKFGKDIRSQFLLDLDEWTFLNHGAFGATLRIPFEVAQLWREHCEKQSLRFIDRQLFSLIVYAQRQLADFVRCNPKDLVFTPNATYALNAVINSAGIQQGDQVYILDVGYGSVKKMLSTRCESAGARVVTAELTFPLLKGDQDIINLVESTLEAGTRLAVFDAVTSNTALVMPLAQIIAICNRKGVPVLIDGAHALGSLPMDLEKLRPDFFVSNCHKWFGNPKGCAFLWVNPEWRQKSGKSVSPVVVSHGTGSGFTSDFIWDGCRDYSPVLAMLTTLQCWKGLKQERVFAYMRSTLQSAVEVLTTEWNTGTLVPLAMCASMALVQLPSIPGVGSPGSATSDDACAVQDWLYDQRIEVPVKCIQKTLYVRISAHVYNVVHDYEILAKAIRRLQNVLHIDQQHKTIKSKL